MVDQLTPDPKQGLAFLQWLNPKAPIYLEAHESVGAARPRSKEYPHDCDDDAQRFITANNNGQRRRNIYFLPNVMLLSGSRAKANISASQFLWVDLDCKDYPGNETEQREAILRLLLDKKFRPAGVPEPTAFWFTGGGYQAISRMFIDITVEEAESHNRALLIAYRAKSGPIDASRLLRLPGTVNWLSETKRAAGRQPAMAFLFEPVAYIAPPATYALSDFRLRLEKATVVASVGTANAVSDLESIEPLPLPEDRGEVIPLDPVWADAIVTGKNPPDKNYQSRSELVFAATLWLLGNGANPGHALSILTSPDLGISAHVLETPNPLRYARRQVTRALQTIDLRAKGWPKVDQDGRPAANSAENVRYALAMLDVDARRNTFTHEDEVTGMGLEGRDITDISDILCSMFGRKLDFRCSVTVIRRELITIAYERQYHPVIDYLDGLVWDGTPRLATWLRDYCGAEDSELNSEFGTKLLIAGVRRIKDPGVKFDNMLVLEGKQGAGKSRLAARLAVRDEWFCGNLNLNADAKTKAELVSRAWIVECQELDGARKATLDAIKAFLATPIDTYRRAYAHNAGSYPRHCVIIGTTTFGMLLATVATGLSVSEPSTSRRLVATSISFGLKRRCERKQASRSCFRRDFGRLRMNSNPAG